MKTKPFVHLHLHTKYSLLDGACHLDQVMDLALENNMPAVAVTDHGVMYGVIDFYKSATAKGVKPIIGCEAYVAREGRLNKRTASNNPTDHLVLLAADNTGYSNLARLISLAHLEGFYYKPRIDKELLSRHSKGLIGLSACLKGEVPSCLLDGNASSALKAAGELADIFGKDNFFLEIQDHRLPEQQKCNVGIKDLARKTGLPLVATNDVHYLRRDHAAAHEVLLCLQTQTVMSDPKRMRYPTNEFYMKTRPEMERLFHDVPDALDRTVDIALRCNVELEFGKLHFPAFKIPEKIPQREYLRKLGWEGLKRRYDITDPERPETPRKREIIDRFNHELDVIDKTGFVNYFLVVWDFVRFAHEKNIPVGAGRGSGGGSLMAYALGITAIDPLQYGLIFERFLNPERVSPPDFDIDFCQMRRSEVIDYVKEKYGRENVAQIITFGSLGPKTVIRDVGRVLEIPFSKCDHLSKMVPEDPKMTLALALDMNPEFKAAYEKDPDCRRILDYGFVIEGLYRNPGTHAAGVVIGEKPLIEIIPLARDKEGQTITQYAMEPLGDIGLLKMDFLGLKTLTVIRETIDLVKKTRGLTIDLDKLPLDDKLTYDLFNRGDTVGVFQLESSGMRDLIRQIGINTIEDLIAMIALYRPGPMNMLDDYVKRKRGKANIRYDHPLLEPILRETYGVMLYQEQVQKAASVLAGYSLGQADILRRAMGKKKEEVMEQQRVHFVQGCAKTSKIDPDRARKIFDVMAKFARYGFNKAHSTGYGIIAYQTAYLKANHPAEFMSALLSSEIGNHDKLPVFIAEAGAIGMEILPPEINSSDVRFMPFDKSIRFGLAGIKNVGTGAAEAVVKERTLRGPYAGLVDFCSRVDSQLANKKVIESLTRCGAFDSIDKNRAKLFQGIDFAMSRAASALRDRRSGQGSLFDLLRGESSPIRADDLPDTPPWSESELLASERELLGTYMSGHPLARYTPLVQKYQLAGITALAGMSDGAATRLGGIIAAVNKKITKTGKEPMAILQLDDFDGSIEVVVWPEPYQKYSQAIVQDAAVLICGEISRKDDKPKLIAHEVYPLADVPRRFATRLSLHVPAVHLTDDTLDRVRQLLSQHPGNTPVVICLQFPSGEKVFLETDTAFRVVADMDLIHGLESLLGEKSVYIATDRTPRKDSTPARQKWHPKPA